MARIVSYGLAGAQNPIYGISHTNIANKLTKDNYFDKAIVRSSDYLWISKAKKGERRKETSTVYAVRFLRSDKKDEDFNTLDEAIDFANNWSDEEGEYPQEYEAPWTVHVMPFRNRN